MRTIKIYCKKCKVQLTEALHEVNNSVLRFDDMVPMIGPHQFSVYTNEYTKEKELVIAIDAYYFKKHTDSRRFSGCCGSSGTDGMNLTCANGHEVATEFSDCYMSHSISVTIENVLVKECTDTYEVREIKL